MERTFAWLTRFRRLAKDDERLPETVIGLHLVAFVSLVLHRVIPFLAAGPLHTLGSRSIRTHHKPA